MQRRIAILFGALALGADLLSAALATPARADIEYAWCAQYSDGNDGGGGVNCGFSTLAQCRATISGIGGRCYENPFYKAPAARSKKNKSRFAH